MKNQKGVTMTMLAITIIVLTILAGITISSSTTLIKSSKIRNYITILSLTKVEAEKIYENYEFEHDVSNMGAAGVNTEDLKVNSTASKIDPQSIISKMSEDEKKRVNEKINKAKDSNGDGTNDTDVDNLWYLWTLQTLDYLKISNTNILKSGETLIVNYATGEVLIPNGVEDEDGVTVYSLTGLINQTNN